MMMLIETICFYWTGRVCQNRLRMKQDSTKMERRVLLLGDVWDSTRDGIGAVNQSLALEL